MRDTYNRRHFHDQFEEAFSCVLGGAPDFDESSRKMAKSARKKFVDATKVRNRSLLFVSASLKHAHVSFVYSTSVHDFDLRLRIKGKILISGRLCLIYNVLDMTIICHHAGELRIAR